MSLPSRLEADQLAHEEEFGFYADFVCGECGEEWSVHFYDGEPVHEDETECPFCPPGQGAAVRA